MGKEKNKIVYLEILRIIAILGVFFNHTETAGIHHYLETTNMVNYWFGIYLASVAQYCIPLFFMITGALLLKRDETITQVYRYRVLKIAIVIVLVVILQSIWNFRGNLTSLNFRIYLQYLYTGGASVPHWFLYTYLSLMMVLPFLQRLAKVIENKSWFLYIFVSWEVLNSFLRIVEFHTGWGRSQLALPMFGSCIVWCLMGYFIENRSDDLFYNKKNIFLLLFISVVLTAESMHVNYLSLEKSHYIAHGDVFASVYAFVMFVIVRYICHQHELPNLLKRIICFAGAGVFGSYLIEAQLREIFYPVYQEMAPRIHSYPAVLLWITVCVLVGILLSNLFKKIPVIGKLI